MNPSEVLAVASMLAVLNERVVEAVTRPLFDNVKQLAPYSWALFYVALVTGSLLGWFSTLNGFATLISDPTVGRVITAVIIGGGSTLVHELLQNAPTGK